MSTNITAQTSTMPRLPLPNPLPPNVVSTDDYNGVLARLEAEVRVRTQLEADLQAARKHAEYLERRLAELTTTSSPPTPSTAPTEAYNTAPATASVPKGEPTDSRAASYAPNVSSPPSEHQQSSSPAPQDKEILSHCSDISNCKGGVTGNRTPDSQSLSRATTTARKSAAVSGGVKKSKAKKERPTKVKIPGQSRYWTPGEHKLFLEALQKYGHKNLRDIAAFVGTRNMTQVRTHSQKYFMRLMREAKRQNPAGKSSDSTSEKMGGAAPSLQEGTNASSTNAAGAVVAAASTNAAVATSVDNNQAMTDAKVSEDGDKYSVPNTCGMTLLCLVGQDTLPV